MSESTLADRLIEAVKIKPNARAIDDLRAHLTALELSSGRNLEPNRGAGALRLLLEMWDRIVAAEKV